MTNVDLLSEVAAAKERVARREASRAAARDFRTPGGHTVFEKSLAKAHASVEQRREHQRATALTYDLRL